MLLVYNFFQDTIFDEFFLAHIFGWWGKAILIRNQPLLWVLSIGFELLEVGLCLFLPLCVSWFIASPVSPPVMCMFYVLQLTFRHMLPNFNECWWDSIVLDILICNWFGMILNPPSILYLLHLNCYVEELSNVLYLFYNVGRDMGWNVYSTLL